MGRIGKTIYAVGAFSNLKGVDVLQWGGIIVNDASRPMGQAPSLRPRRLEDAGMRAFKVPVYVTRDPE